MKTYSAITQAVFDAFDHRYEANGPLEDWMEPCIAAALQAVIDNVHYDEHLDTHDDYIVRLLAIVSELKQ